MNLTRSSTLLLNFLILCVLLPSSCPSTTCSCIIGPIYTHVHSKSKEARSRFNPSWLLRTVQASGTCLVSTPHRSALPVFFQHSRAMDDDVDFFTRKPLPSKLKRKPKALKGETNGAASKLGEGSSQVKQPPSSASATMTMMPCWGLMETTTMTKRRLFY